MSGRVRRYRRCGSGSSREPVPAVNGNPPAVLLGGGISALSAARSLAAAGIAVHVLDRPSSAARQSRAVTAFVDVGEDQPQERMLAWLRSTELGAVVLAASDDGVELIARHRAELVAHGYCPAEANDDVLLAMLDKLRTYDIARQRGIAVPRIIRLSHDRGLEAAIEGLEYPCVLKPAQSHLFARRGRTRAKVLIANDAVELRRDFARFSALGVEMFVTEVIYGDSDEFVSYYGYLDERGDSLVHLTKRKLRQLPPGFGIGTYHETTRDPEVAAAGLRFFQAVGLRGLGNVEFKRDARNGELILIECNPRFTLSNELIRIAGIDLALLCYDRVLGRTPPRMEAYRVGLHLWDPARDWRAFRDYGRRGELSSYAWSKSLLHRQVFPTFRLDDPLPALSRANAMISTARVADSVGCAAPSTESASRKDRTAKPAATIRALDRLANGRGPRGRAVAARLDLAYACGVRPFMRRIRAERRLSGLGPAARDRVYEAIWLRAAEECGARMVRLAPGLLELCCNETRTRVHHQLTTLDDPVTLQVALDKTMVHTLMSDVGAPHAEYLEWAADNPGPAMSFLANVEGPCVVKPAAGTGGGHGVVPGVALPGELLRARWHAAAQCDRLLIERQISGSVYRLLLLDGELLDVVRSMPANVTGDGRSTLEELILQENERRVAARGQAGLSLIGLNLDTVLTLRRAGVTLSSVLAEGHYLPLRCATNNNAARDNATWRAEVHPSVVEHARAAANAVGLRLAGVDVVTTDISTPLTETGGALSEVNGAPGLHHHYLVADPDDATPVTVPVLERLLESVGIA